MKKTILIEAEINTIDDIHCSCLCRFFNNINKNYNTYNAFCALKSNGEDIKIDNNLLFKRTSFCIELEKEFISKGGKTVNPN